MNIIQSFYDHMAQQYDKLFADWEAAVQEQATLLDGIFQKHGFTHTAQVLDCACGIGTQAIGLAALGYSVTASDISDRELEQAKQRAENRGVRMRLAHADFCRLSDVFAEPFDIVIAMDNALPHMLTHEQLAKAVNSMCGQLKPGGLLTASIRDYDRLLKDQPPYSPPYIHPTDKGQRVSFQTWNWQGDLYHLTQYIIDDTDTLTVHKFSCDYRAVRRAEITKLLVAAGCRDVQWVMPAESGFYQPMVTARKAYADML